MTLNDYLTAMGLSQRAAARQLSAFEAARVGSPVAFNQAQISKAARGRFSARLIMAIEAWTGGQVTALSCADQHSSPTHAAPPRHECQT